MKVALFIPCLSEHLFPESALAMVRVLRFLGIETEYVENQTCCGQPAFNSGYVPETIALARRFIKLFQGHEYIVAPSGSCVSMVRLHYGDLPLEGEVREHWTDLRERIFEFSEFLVDVLQLTDLGGRFAHRVTYHDSCHLLRELDVREQPRKLIAAIKDIDFVEMSASDVCCGFGGTFSYKFKELSVAMVERKARSIIESGAEYCVGADSSCLMNIGGYLDQAGVRVKTMHIADLLARSLDL